MCGKIFLRFISFYLILLLVNTGTTLFENQLLADDWPQWMGPQRDNVWREDRILKKFPNGGPEVVWRSPVAGGYAGPSVADGRVFVTDYVKGDQGGAGSEIKRVTGIERVLCLDQANGQLLWKHEYPVRYTMSYPAGPRCTPIVDGGLVYTLGGEGNLFCFRVKDGEIVWSKDLVKEYDTKTAIWGYASHPLIDGDKLICIVGGEGSHVVAFNKHTGEEIWRALTSSEQGYCPPTIIEAGGVRQLVLLYPDAMSAVDPETGELYWSVDYEASYGSIIMTPAKVGDYLFGGGFSNKNILVKLSKDRPTAELVWRDLPKQAMSPVNVQPMIDGSVLYGFHQDGSFMAIDIPSGKRLWTTGEPLSERPVRCGTAFIVRHEDRYFLFTEQGELIIANLSPQGFQPLSRAKVIEPTNVAYGRDVVWSAPAWAGRCVFIRNDRECICVKLSDE